MKLLYNYRFGFSLLLLLGILSSCEHLPEPTCVDVIIKVEISKTDATRGKADGSIAVVAIGDSKYFTYSINGSDFQASSKFVGLDTGKVTVTVKNSWGCTGNGEIRIDQIDPCKGVSLTATTTNSTLGQATGIVTAVLSGGTGYTFSLDGGTPQSSNIFSGLAAGNHSITAKNTAGCAFTVQALVGESNPCNGVTVSLTTTLVSPTLSQSNGTITAVAAGATGFTYSLNSGPFQASGVFTGLAAGNYTITAKSATGCIGTTQVGLNATNLCAGVTVTVTTTAVNPGINLSNGTITASATGGTGFSYSINGTTFQSSGTFANLSAGNYTITAKSADGCVGTKQVALGATNPCAGIAIGVTATVTGSAIGLASGSIVSTATGGTGFTFSINNGAFQASGSFLNLAAGNYIVTAKSADGCLGSATFTVNSINPCTGVTVVVTGTVTNASIGQANGSIQVIAVGGTGFSYSINGGAFQTGTAFSALAAGSYTVTAKSSAGCMGSATFSVGSNDPCANTSIVVTGATTPSKNCVSPGTGSIAISASGSTGLTYNLNNGAYQSNTTFSGLTPGTYTLGVKDANNCTNSTTAVVGSLPAGPAFLAVKVLIQGRCSGSGCHMNGQTQKGYNFDTDCNIVKFWSGIYGSTVTHTLNTMPLSPQPQLTAAEKQSITNWVNAGHGFEN